MHISAMLLDVATAAVINLARAPCFKSYILFLDNNALAFISVEVISIAFNHIMLVMYTYRRQHSMVYTAAH